MPQSYSNSQNHFFLGYTLLELIVVVGIVLIFSGLLLAQYGNYIEQSKLRLSSQQLSDVFSLAQKKSLTKDVMPTCVDNFNGYQVLLSSNQYTLSYCCLDNCSYSTLNTYNFPSHVSFASGPGSGSPYPIQFKPLTRGTSLSDSIDLYLANSQIGGSKKCTHMKLSNIGIISLDSTFISCP